MIQKQHWRELDRVIITDEASNAIVQLDIFRKDDKDRREIYEADCLLWSLWVSPPYQGRGTGERLMALAENMAREEGCKSVALEWDERDSEEWVRDWYKRRGYEVRAFGRFNLLMVKQLK